MAIIEGGVFTIPLYHGTTGLFMESIKRYGLGAKDPLTELKAKEFMSDLYELAENQRWSDNEWLKMRECLKPIVFQRKTENVVNFKHGGSYLTYSPQLARKYAIENSLGCEYLTYLRLLLNILTSRNVKGLKERFLDQPVLRVWEKPHDPYLVVLNCVKVGDVETEAGEDFIDHINKIEELIKNGVYGPQSFKLRKFISNEALKIKKLGAWCLATGNLIENEDIALK